MSKQAFRTVEKSFTDEVDQAFRLLVTDFGLGGPERHGVVMQVVTFIGPGVQYRVALDQDDKAVVTRVEVDLEAGAGALVAELDELVAAAGLGKHEDVPHSAHTLYSLRATLRSHARFVRRLHPLVDSPTGADLLREAKARVWRAGR